MHGFFATLFLALLAAAPAVAQDAIGEAAQRIVAEAGEHKLILLGEMHGTREAPRLVSRLAALYAAKQPIGVALEIDAGLNPAIETFLASDDGETARAKLLERPYWYVEPARSDGRRNLELIALLEDLRQLRAGGATVVVLGVDNPPFGKTDSQARDKAMADRLLEALRGSTRSRVLVLTGNVHAMRARPAYAPPEMQAPMGSYLADLQPFSVDIAARGGQFRACLATCAPMEQAAMFTETQRLHDDVFDLRVVLPSFSLAPLIADGPTTSDAQAREFLRRLEADTEDEWIGGQGQEWLEQMSPEAKLRVAELGMASANPRLQFFAPVLLYSLGMDERGDAGVAELVVRGVDITGLGWSWIHSGDAGLMERRLAGVRAALRARHATLTPEQRKRAKDLLCEEAKPCDLP
jgi:hypothetical protein